MKNFPEAIGLETNSSLQDGNKSEISNWGKEVLNLEKDGAKIVKNLNFFEQRYLYFSITVRLNVPKFLKWVYLKEEFEYYVLKAVHTAVQEFSPNPLYQSLVGYVSSRTLKENIHLKKQVHLSGIFSLIAVSHIV